MNIFALPALYKSQQEAHEVHCFGDCGKVSIEGVIEVPKAGPCWMCREENCPYEKGRTPQVGEHGTTGEPVFVRALNPVTK